MKEFTGWEYLLIDVANNYGHDKLRFEERIVWVTEHLNELEDLAVGRSWKQRPMYIKAVLAVRKAQRSEPSGHLVGFDAICSGMQLMSVLTGCMAGAKATGLVDVDRRADAYTDCTKLMSDALGRHLPDERDRVKNAVMTSLYGSKAEPKKEFGDGTTELAAFYEAMFELAPGPTELLGDLVGSWQPYALAHQWKLPDGFDVRVKVMQQVEKRIEVDELNHATFTYVYYENEGCRRDVKNAANVVHSIDAYVLRSLARRCNYDGAHVSDVGAVITAELLERSLCTCPTNIRPAGKVAYYVDQYQRSSVADIVILPYLHTGNIHSLTTEHLVELNKIINTMLAHKPFEVVTVHDDFKAHPNNLNHLRRHYRNILAELAGSELLNDLLSQLYGFSGTFQKKSTNLAEKIYNSRYALC
jgi:Schitoviridae RNA polymerase